MPSVGILSSTAAVTGITLASVGARTTGNAGTITTAVARPVTGNVAGNITLVGRTIKPSTATGSVESGWTQQINVTGGTGTAAIDAGTTRLVVDYQILAGGESGSVTFDQTTSPDSVASCMITYSKSSGTWEIVSTTGDDNTHGTGRTATGAAINLQVDDRLIAFVASCTDATTAYTSPAFTATGMTFGTVTQQLPAGGVSQGFDSGIAIIDALIIAGTAASVAPTFTCTGGPSSCGAVGFIRLRMM